MMVETILESSQDFGMSNGALPQWKRELLQRRAARSRPPAPPAAPPPPPPPPPPTLTNDDEEELHYGPGIVNRLKTRYLSLALRDAPRRRPSVLRRATSLEHLLDERPPAAPGPRPLAPRPPRPASLAAPAHALARRDFVKRARSVDALSRLESREEPQPPSPPPAPAPRPPQPRAARPPRRPTPLLRDTERPPPDVVRSTLRKFETAPARRAAPAARISAVLRGLEAGPRGSTPEPARSPSPPAEPEPAADDERPGAAEARPVSRTALEGIARAGSTVRYAFEAPMGGSHLPPLAATNPVLLGRARRVGVIRPMPTPERAPPSPPSSPPADAPAKMVVAAPPRVAAPPAPDSEPAPAPRLVRREPPPSALVEPIPRTPEPRPTTPVERLPTPEPVLTPGPTPTPEPRPSQEMTPTQEAKPIPEPVPTSEPMPTPPASSPVLDSKSIGEPKPIVELQPAPRSKPMLEPRPVARADPISMPKFGPTVEPKVCPEVGPKRVMEAALVNGHATPECKVSSVSSRIGAAGIERAWSGSVDRSVASAPAPGVVSAGSAGADSAGAGSVSAWSRGSPAAPRRGRAPPPAPANSVVFNFSNRKEVPDYIENDGLILRASRRNRFKAGEAGVVLLRPESGGESRDLSPSEEEGEEETDASVPVRFLNDNVLINGRSSMPTRPDRDRIAKLKLQFDDSLTRTFEYPSENSLCEDSPSSPSAVPGSTPATQAGTPAQQQQLAEPAVMAPLAANTHIASAALSEYTPSKTPRATFTLGVTRQQHYHQGEAGATGEAGEEGETSSNSQTDDSEVGERQSEGPDGSEEASERDGEMRACGADVACSWSEARTHRTDLLF